MSVVISTLYSDRIHSILFMKLQNNVCLSIIVNQKAIMLPKLPD